LAAFFLMAKAQRGRALVLPAIVQPAVSKREPIHRHVTHLAPGGGGDELRALANDHADRRHTVIQLELAAAHFETRRRGMVGMPSEPSVWDEFITAESHKLRMAQKRRRSLRTQLDALSMYMDRGSMLKRGAKPAVLKDLRTSDLQRFEVLRKQLGRPSPRPAAVTFSSETVPHISPRSVMPGSMQRRKSVVSALPPLLTGGRA
jgi:hypothetical protein